MFSVSVVQGVLMMLLPVVVLLLVRRRMTVYWGWAGIGALLFFVVQLPKAPHSLAVLDLPKWVPALSADGWQQNWLFLVLIAAVPGIWEELFKWLPMRIVKPVNWAAVLSFGLGFGGFESLLIGFNVALSAVFAQVAPGLLPEEVVATLTGPFAPVALFTALLAVLERSMAIALHTAWAVMNARAVMLRRISLMFSAMLLHTAVDVLAAYYQFVNSSLTTLVFVEAGLIVFGLAGIAYIRRTVAEPWPGTTAEA